MTTTTTGSHAYSTWVLSIFSSITTSVRELRPAIGGSGWHDASCVHPNLYAERFIRFFDEYSQLIVDGEIRPQDGEEAVEF